MVKSLKTSDVDKLQKKLCKISSLRSALSILYEDAPVLVSVANSMGRSERFHVEKASSKDQISYVVKELLKAEKDAIRKKYNIDIK